MSVLSKLSKGLFKTKSGLVYGIKKAVSKTNRIDDNLLDELEELVHVVGNYAVPAGSQILFLLPPTPQGFRRFLLIHKSWPGNVAN